MRPGPRAERALLALCAASLLVPVFGPIVWLLVAGLVAFVVASSVEAVILWRTRIDLDREEHTALSIDEVEKIPMGLSTTGRWPVSIVLRQRWPRLVAEESTVARGVCRPGEVLEVEYEVRGVGRGSEPLEPPTVALTRWGLAERIVCVGRASRLSVLPNLKAVRRLHQQMNQAFLRGLGNRTAPRLGKGRDFDRLRDYVQGDDFRDIAWRASARHDRLIVREFRIDRSQDILVCLDRGHRMAARVGWITKLDHSVNASVLIAYLSNRMEDKVGLLSFGSEVEFGIGQGRGAGHLRRLTGYLTGLRSEYIHTDYRALGVHIGRRLRHRSLVLILTDLPEGDSRHDLIRAVRVLTPTHLPLIVCPTDPALEAGASILPGSFGELCRSLVSRDVFVARRQLIRELRNLGAFVVESSPQRIGLEAINAYIEIKRRQLL